MFYLLYICKNAKEKENQTEINKSNQIKSKSNQVQSEHTHQLCLHRRLQENIQIKHGQCP